MSILSYIYCEVLHIQSLAFSLLHATSPLGIRLNGRTCKSAPEYLFQSNEVVPVITVLVLNKESKINAWKNDILVYGLVLQHYVNVSNDPTVCG